MKKLKIKVKRLASDIQLPTSIKKGDWIDLRLAETSKLLGGPGNLNKVHILPLGVAMELPDGFEAVIALRSSAPKKWNVVCANSVGVVDNSYKGDNDQWMLPVVALQTTTIPKGTRLCQFRIQLSQKATFMQKLKWFFSSGIEIEEVDALGNEDRKGLGKGTGV